MPVNDYCTLTEAKDMLPDGSWGTSYDVLLGTVVTRASRAIDAFLGRKPGAFYVTTDTTCYFDGSGHAELWIDELAAAPTSVSMAESGMVDGSGGTGGIYTLIGASDYWCWPDNAVERGTPYLRLDLDVVNGNYSQWYAFRRGVKIVGRFGFSTAVPDEVKQAAVIQTVRWFKRGQQAFSDVSGVSDLGQLQYVQRLDPDIAAILSVPKFQRLTV
jgi:hypothetical protein